MGGACGAIRPRRVEWRMTLPRSGVELIERVAERWRWIAYRIRFHPFTTQELPKILDGLGEYGRLMRLDRPIGIWLLLWPTLWALWISSRGKPNPRIFIIFVAGTVLMRCAGCVINDYADRSFDPHVARTKDRPLAAGRISTLEALVLFAGLSIIALMLALQLNKATLLLAVVGGFLAISYPFVKRFLAVPQMYLGVTFGWGIPMAFGVKFGEVAQVAWCDTMYAMGERDDDVKIGVRSTAIGFGDSDRNIIAVLQAMTLLCLYLGGRMSHWGWCDAG